VLWPLALRTFGEQQRPGSRQVAVGVAGREGRLFDAVLIFAGAVLDVMRSLFPLPCDFELRERFFEEL